jgi:hypothetical protein
LRGSRSPSLCVFSAVPCRGALMRDYFFGQTDE